MFDRFLCVVAKQNKGIWFGSEKSIIMWHSTALCLCDVMQQNSIPVGDLCVEELFALFGGTMVLRKGPLSLKRILYFVSKHSWKR